MPSSEQKRWDVKADSFGIKGCAINHDALEPPSLQGQGRVLQRCYRSRAETPAPPRQGSEDQGLGTQSSNVWPDGETALLLRDVKVALPVGAM